MAGEGNQWGEEFGGTDRFQVLDAFGRGATGVVYRAHDNEMDVDVALKTFTARQPGQLFGLKQEFRILADILHPNLVELYELFVEENRGFFTMEAVDGGRLLEHLGVAVDARGAPLAALNPSRLADFLHLLGQLAEGLGAVHAAGKLHRDIKPNNLLVTRGGRLVLLDFGFAVAFGRGVRPEPGGTAGTLAYIAPELLDEGPLTPAADWYSVGVVLYEVLTGRLPFVGSAAEIFEHKRHTAPPPPPRLLCPAIPAAVDALAMSLLARDPDERGGATAILQLVAHAPHRQPSRLPEEHPFVGRTAELEQLRQSLVAASAGQPAAVHIVGPSGIGKSELLRRFLAQLEEEDTHLVLRGRCHPQEAVPYRSLDRMIDDLSGVLGQLPEDAVEALRPAHVAALLRLFPVLQQVTGLATPEAIDEQADPLEVRHHGFLALRELLQRLGRRKPLVVWIDDLQWGDADSIPLLRELMRLPDAPRALWIISYRSEDGDTVLLPEAAETPGTELIPGRRIDIGPLDAAATRSLAAALCRMQILSDDRLAQIVEEAGGNPFFVNELSQVLESGAEHADPAAAATVPRLRDVMQIRARQLSSLGRDLLEVVSIAGGPLPRSLALQAAGLGERGRPLVAALERRCLLRTTRVDDRPAVEVYHDRFREALLSHLDEPRRRTLHRQMAETLLTQETQDAQALFTHFLGAGERAAAGKYAYLAALAAARALAFDQAVYLYRQALELSGETADKPRLLTGLAEALANAGRGREAGECFEAAAAAVANEGQAHEVVLDLRRQAAEHYLRSGYIEPGFRVTRTVLEGVGVDFPDSPQEALKAVLRLRARHAWRGVRFVARPPEAIAPSLRLRLAACRGASFGLGSVDLLRAEAIGVRHLCEALDSGDESHISQALQFEAIKNVQFGGAFLRRRGARLLALADTMAQRSNDPYSTVGMHFGRAACAFQEGRWRSVVEHCERARVAARERWVGLRFERVTIDAFIFAALAQMGDLPRLAADVPVALAIAAERDDRYAVIALWSGMCSLLWLAQDRAAEVRSVIDAEIARWPADTFLLQHYLHLIATVHTELYRGDVWAAWRHLQAVWPKLRAALYLWMESPAVELRNLRARVALAAALQERTELPPGAQPADPDWPRKRLLKVVAGDAKALAKSRGVVPAAAFSQALNGWLAHAAGRDEQAVRLLHAAGEQFASADMALYAAAMRYAEGTLQGGAGDDLRGASRAWLEAQGVRRPERLLGIFIPPVRERS